MEFLLVLVAAAGIWMITTNGRVKVSNIKPETNYAIQVVESIYREFGMTFKLTSLAGDYKRSGFNYHDLGWAFDFAFPEDSNGYFAHKPNAEQMAKLIRDQLGDEYDVVVEYKGITPGATGNHIHIEFDAKRAGRIS